MTQYKQDLPPEGGFGKIHYESVPPKRWVTNRKLAIGLIAMLAYSGYQNRKYRRRLFYDQVADYDALIAMEPFLEAERDRSFLIQLYKNREMEKLVMKDVPGWQPGTFYGKPYFKTLKPDELVPECQGSFNLFSDNELSRVADPTKQGLAEWSLN